LPAIHKSCGAIVVVVIVVVVVVVAADIVPSLPELVSALPYPHWNSRGASNLR